MLGPDALAILTMTKKKIDLTALYEAAQEARSTETHYVVRRKRAPRR